MCINPYYDNVSFHDTYYVYVIKLHISNKIYFTSYKHFYFQCPFSVEKVMRPNLIC